MNPNYSAGFREYFSEHKAFRYWEGLYHQVGMAPLRLEREYAALRASEGRMLPDAIVKTLPNVPREHPQRREWSVRGRSAEMLGRHLKKTNPKRILEIGCGNGWLTNYLASQTLADCCGIDINEIELKQAVRLFPNSNRITFVYGDITSSAFDDCRTDVIICASVIQYFPHVHQVIDRLKDLLHSGGEIHIVDTPLYREKDAPAAKTRSLDYFTKLGHPGMVSYYHHHTWESLRGYRYVVLHDPVSLLGRIRSWLGLSPFPWIVIQK